MCLLHVQFMKFIYLLIAFFSWSNIQSLSAQNDDDLIRRLKLTDARLIGLEESFDFKLSYHRKLEGLYEAAILERYNLGDALGRKREELDVKSYLIRQVFIPIGQRISYSEEEALVALADSILNLYSHEPSASKFKSLIEMYSADKTTHWISSLDETKEFQAVVSAQQIGEISRPFKTPKGIHIVQKLKESDRIISETKPDFPALDTYFDDLNINVDKAAKSKIQQANSQKEVLIQSDYTKFTTEDFSRYALSGTTRGVDMIWNDFLKYALIQDIRVRLDHDKAFSVSKNNLYEEALLSSVYKQRVLDLVEEDGLNRFFETQKANYTWSKERFVGMLVFCKNKKVLRALHKELEKEPLNKWENIISLFNAEEQLIVYEKGSFEEGENPSIDAFVFKKGKKSKAKRKGFSKVQIYGEILSGPNTLTDDIKSIVEADYLKFIEKEWEKDLVSKYKAGKMSPIFLKSVNIQTSN